VIKLTRRRLLHLIAGPAALHITSRIAMAQNNPSPPLSAPRERPLAERLADYAHALRHDDLDAATVERIKVHVIDTIGCGIGAFEEKAVRICREIALAVPGTATVIGTSARTTPDLASFANGAAFRYLDFNDTYVGRFAVHPSDTIAACLAVAEAERANAQDLMTAIALAYEVNSRLVDSLDIAARGWDPPVFSLPAVALAAGKLMKLDPERLTHAVGLAIDGADPDTDSVRLERARGRRSGAQCRLRRAAGTRWRDWPDADF
jgi:2-methylcitrate dehydratase